MAGSGRRNADFVLIVALAGGAPLRDAAAQAGVSERTARRRTGDQEFMRRVSQTRTEMIDRAVGVLTEASVQAATTLCSLLSAESETVRLGACRALLELGVKLRESEDLSTRVAALEEASVAAQMPVPLRRMLTPP